MKNNIIIRRFISAVLTLLLIFTMFGVTPAYAAGITEITFGAVMGEAGEEVTVPVTIKNNPGIATFRFRITYDTKSLEFISVENGAVTEDGTISSMTNAEKQTVTFIWYSTDNVYGDGEIALLKFKFAANAIGNFPLSVTCLPEDMLNEEKNSVEYTVYGGEVYVGCAHTSKIFTTAKVANCQAGGWNAYYTCNNCGQLLATDGMTEIDAIPLTNRDASNHTNVKYFAADTATCVHQGNEAYSKCADCGVITSGSDTKFYGEHNYGTLIAATSQKHTTTELTAAVDAHYYCDVCNTYFTENKVKTTLAALTGEIPSHSYSGWVTTNSAQHWKECSCGKKTEVAAHKYTNTCDASCNICGFTRTPSAHIYDHIYDAECNVCGETRGATPLEWQINVTKTGVYTLKPNSKYTGEFSVDKIAVLDKNGKEVFYYEKLGGFPLVKGQNYTVKFRYDCADEITGTITWTKTKKVDTIFSDTLTAEKGGWYNDAVTYSVGAGLITGYGGTNLFGTADNIQRQDFVVILARLAGVDLTNYQSNRSSFADVPSGAYYEKAILWAADCGITTGYNDGTNRFGVGDKITREQLVTFLYRYAKYVNGGMAPSVSADAEQKAQNYADYNGVTDYAQEAIIWALDKGVISGQGGTKIAPAGNALRCEIAQIMYNIFLNDIF